MSARLADQGAHSSTCHPLLVLGLDMYPYLPFTRVSELQVQSFMLTPRAIPPVPHNNYYSTNS